MIENGLPVIMPDPEGKPLAGEIYTVDDETLERDEFRLRRILHFRSNWRIPLR